MSQKNPIPFVDFIASFPKIELPITLTDSSIHIFNQENDPFSEQMILQNLVPLDGEEMDEFTEFTPCFALDQTYDILAVVFWKASLLNHQYILATFTKKAELIDKKVIAGTFSDGKVLVQSVATIDEDWEILIVSGQKPASDNFRFDPAKSTTQKFEILPEGQIVSIP